MGRMILFVRPQPGLSQSVAAAEAMGLNAIGYPLFEIEPCAWECPDPAGIDALLIGSANAIRHGGSALSRLTDKPVYAVGEATAKCAREAGFTIGSVGAGGLQNVVDGLPAPLRLLRISGAEHTEIIAPDSITIDTRIAYKTRALELPESLRALGTMELTVALHSAAAARQFAQESRRLALSRQRIELAVIGPRVADAAGEGWADIHISPQPNEGALLELLREKCI